MTLFVAYRAFLLGLMSILFAGTGIIPAVASANCERHLSLEYGGHLCLNGVCDELHQRWQFLGQQIFVYPSLPEERGIIWVLGQTVDMTTNGSDPEFLPHINHSESQTASADAVASGQDFILSRHVQVKDNDGKVEANTWLRIVVRVLDCGRCTLMTYDMSGESGHVPSQSTLTGNWCRIVP